MIRRTEPCVVWTCDDCNEECKKDGATLHFTADDAPTGWETIDGKDVCDECVLRRECAEKGHEWGEWGPACWLPEGAEEYRRCLRCFDAMETRPRTDGAS